MSWEGRELAILAATVLAAFAVLASTAMLVADAAVAHKRAPLDAERVEALQERVHTEAEAAVELEAERKLQTETSLRRATVQQRLGWVLLAATVAFVTGAKWLQPGQEQRPAASLVQLTPRSASEGHEPLPMGRETPNSPDTEETPEPDYDLAFVDDLVAKHGAGREGAIPILQAIQEQFRYLPDGVLRHLCEQTEITLAQIAGTSTFYARFRHSPVGEHVVRICHGTACHVAGARHVDDELRRRLAIPSGADTDPNRQFTLEPVACVGCCSLAPVMMIGEDTAGHLTPATAGDRLAAMAALVEEA